MTAKLDEETEKAFSDLGKYIPSVHGGKDCFALATLRSKLVEAQRRIAEQAEELAYIENLTRSRARLSNRASLLECIEWAIECRDSACDKAIKQATRIAELEARGGHAQPARESVRKAHEAVNKIYKKCQDTTGLDDLFAEADIAIDAIVAAPERAMPGREEMAARIANMVWRKPPEDAPEDAKAREAEIEKLATEAKRRERAYAAIDRLAALAKEPR